MQTMCQKFCTNREREESIVLFAILFFLSVLLVFSVMFGFSPGIQTNVVLGRNASWGYMREMSGQGSSPSVIAGLDPAIPGQAGE